MWREVLEMSEAIIVALITGVLSLIGCIISGAIQHGKTTAVIEYKVNDLKDDIVTLSKRVDEHNHLKERMGVLEERVNGLQK